MIADGVNIAKEGKKMPAVKSLHQASSSNSKAEYIMGHYLQAVSLAVVTPLGKIAAIPLVSQIHDGITKSNRHKKTLITKLADLLNKLTKLSSKPAVVVADAYYAASTMINPLKTKGNHVVTRVQRNAVAYHPAEKSPPGTRGRPKKYGVKVILNDLFKKFDAISVIGDDTNYVK